MGDAAVKLKSRIQTARYLSVVSALAIALIAPLVMASQASADPAGDPLVDPDLGVACGLMIPDNNVTFSYRADVPLYTFTSERPTCHYLEVSGGDAENGAGVFPSGYIKWPVAADWGKTCRLAYGPQAYGHRMPDGSVKCAKYDVDYNVKAQGEANRKLNEHNLGG